MLNFVVVVCQYATCMHVHCSPEEPLQSLLFELVGQYTHPFSFGHDRCDNTLRYSPKLPGKQTAAAAFLEDVCETCDAGRATATILCSNPLLQVGVPELQRACGEALITHSVTAIETKQMDLFQNFVCALWRLPITSPGRAADY